MGRITLAIVFLVGCAANDAGTAPPGPDDGADGSGGAGGMGRQIGHPDAGLPPDAGPEATAEAPTPDAGPETMVAPDVAPDRAPDASTGWPGACDPVHPTCRCVWACAGAYCDDWPGRQTQGGVCGGGHTAYECAAGLGCFIVTCGGGVCHECRAYCNGDGDCPAPLRCTGRVPGTMCGEMVPSGAGFCQ